MKNLTQAVSAFKKNLRFSKIKLYLDVGSFTTRVVMNDQLVFSQPTCFLLRQEGGEVLTSGDSAMMVCGKEPIGTEVVFPIKQGVVYDQKQFNLFLSAVIKQLKKEISWPWLARAEVVYAIPASATELDQKIIKQSLTEAGFNKISLVRKASLLLAQIGGKGAQRGGGTGRDQGNQRGGQLGAQRRGLANGQGTRFLTKKGGFFQIKPDQADSVSESVGKNQIMVIDMGDETTEVMIGSGEMISFNQTIPLGGKKITNAICQSLKQEHDLLISFQQALKIKHNLQYQFAEETSSTESKFQTDQKNQINIRGISTSSHTIKTKTIRSEELIMVIEQELEKLSYQIKQILNQVKSEQLISALNNGVILTGGASQLFGVDDYFAMQLQTNVVKRQVG